MPGETTNVTITVSEGSVSQSSLGAVGYSLNPGGSLEVANIKLLAAALITECEKQRERGIPEVARMASIAITEAQTAQMWAVKAATWRT